MIKSIKNKLKKLSITKVNKIFPETNININQIIIIQKYIRGYLIRKHILIPSSYYQTKEWHKNRKWNKNGKLNECEKYQINLIEKIIANKLSKTYDRINTENNEIISRQNLILNDDSFELTENFNGKILKNNNIYYFNLSFVCDNGATQIKTLKREYEFIKYQLEYLIEFNKDYNKDFNKVYTCNIYFINILDGDASYNNMNKFIFLLNKEKYKNIVKYIFIGSLYDFQRHKIKLQIT